MGLGGIALVHREPSRRGDTPNSITLHTDLFIRKQGILDVYLRGNKNGVPFDPQSPFVTSGIRLGTPAGTSRGFGEKEFEIIGNYIGDVLDGLSANPDNNSSLENEVKLKVKSLCRKFPIYTSVIS